MEGCKALRGIFCVLLLTTCAAVGVSAVDNPPWYPGPKFAVDQNAAAVNTFQGQVAPTGQNQLQNIVTMDEAGVNVDAQNLQIKDVIFTYGPVIPSDPVRVGRAGPSVTQYLSNPVMEGALVEGVNIQINAKPGYHFVSVSFGVAISGQFLSVSNAFFIDGLGSSTVGSGGIAMANVLGAQSEGKFVATNIYTSQITIVPNSNVPSTGRFALDNVQYVLEKN